MGCRVGQLPELSPPARPFGADSPKELQPQHGARGPRRARGRRAAWACGSPSSDRCAAQTTRGPQHGLIGGGVQWYKGPVFSLAVSAIVGQLTPVRMELVALLALYWRGACRIGPWSMCRPVGP